MILVMIKAPNVITFDHNINSADSRSTHAELYQLLVAQELHFVD